MAFIRCPSALADDIARTVLGFHIDFSDVFADDTEGNQLNAADKADDTGSRCPAGNRMAENGLHNRPNDADKADETHNSAQTGNHADGLDGQAGDAVKRERKHFAQRIMAFACDALGAFVIDLGARKTDQWNHAAQEDVDLAEIRKAFQDARALQELHLQKRKKINL